VGFKVVLLLIVSAALAVSIEFPSFVLSHPNYPNPAHTTLENLKGRSTSSPTLADAISKMSDAKSWDVSKLTFGNIHPFPPSDRFFPQFMLSQPNTDPVGPPPQDSTSQSTSSSSLSDFYLKNPHE
jgi:hypothetical protein